MNNNKLLSFATGVALVVMILMVTWFFVDSSLQVAQASDSAAMSAFWGTMVFPVAPAVVALLVSLFVKKALQKP